MARTLEQLKAQYNSVSHGVSLRGGMPGGRPGPGAHGAGRAQGKPKNTKNTIKRLLTYVGRYKGRLLLVLICMMLTTLSSLCAGYLLVPIINRITLAINPTAELAPSAIAIIADNIIEF